MKICFISSYLSFSAISQFNQDLIHYLKLIDKKIEFCGVAINNEDKIIKNYPRYVKFQIRKNIIDDYHAAADYINNSNIDIVCLQHEFSLFGGFGGKYILQLISRLKKPVFCVAHIIPIRKDARKPITKKKFFLQSALKLEKIIVLVPGGREKIISWGIPSQKVQTILHGAPSLFFHKNSVSKNDLRKELGLNRSAYLILNYGYFNHTKGIEHAIRAMRYVKLKKINAQLLLVGLPSEGKDSEIYTRKLEGLINKLKLGHQVVWRKIYLNNNDLLKYILASDIGILPYVYRSYSSSGVLTFFTAVKIPIICTRFSYAQFLLKDAAYFVPFANSRAIFNTICEAKDNPEHYQEIEDKLNIIRQQISWRNVAEEYLEVIREILS